MSTTMHETALLGWAWSEVPLGRLAEFRRQAPPLPDQSGVALALRHADEHTLAGLEAIRHTIQSMGKSYDGFADWGVVASSRFPGRTVMAHLIHRYKKLGPLGVSPMSVPTLSLHSGSGTLSLVFGMTGPNFGISGGPDHVREGLLAAMAIKSDGHAPGIWLVMTASSPELTPNRADGKADGAGSVFGLALALAADSNAEAAVRLRLTQARQPGSSEPISLFDFVQGFTSHRSDWSHTFADGLCCEFRRPVVQRRMAG